MPDPTAAWLWLSGSLLLAVLWTNLAWFFRQSRSETMSDLITPLITWRFAPQLLELLRLLYYVGVPYGALLWGHDAVLEGLLGLGGEKANVAPAANWLDWARDVGWTAALGIGAWAVLALGWWAYRRALAAADSEVEVGGANVSGWVLLREAAYHEVHWAFYRNAPILALGAYGGIWTGLALAALEAALNPAWRKGLTDPRTAPAQLMRGALAVVSSLLFLMTQNLWLALALHWGVSWGLSVLVRET
ncbi:MAG: hypothetical protein KKC18_01925 [Chloroflexi bacterium]|nr:hypothetical protein [Chloroflexota bacterium]